MGKKEMVEAAARLRHDLGKYIRFSAPEMIEADTAALRARLRTDVLATRRTARSVRSAEQVFEDWRRQEAGRFLAGHAAADTLARLARTMEQIARLSTEIDSLDRPGLERLDALTLDAARECRALAVEAKT